MPQKNYKIKSDQRGSVLLFSLIILGAILITTFSISALLIPRLAIIKGAASSVSALYAADSASEWCMQGIRLSDPYPPVAGTILHLNFDESVGTTALDSSGNGYNGNLTGGPVWTSFMGRTGPGSLLFDGVDDKVSLGDVAGLDAPAAYTISAWIYPRSFGQGGSANFMRIIDKRNQTGAAIDPWTTGYQFWIGNQGNVANLEVNHNAMAPVTSNNNIITLNQWQHVAVTFNGSNFTFYRNGINVGGGGYGPGVCDPTPPGSYYCPIPVANTIPAIVGGRSGGTDREFDGYIDDLRMYNRVLAAAEISAMIPTFPPLVMNNGATYAVYAPASSTTAVPCMGTLINHRAVGTYRGVARSLELY